MIIKQRLFVNKKEEETERKILGQRFIACPISEPNIRLW
jgi:hypothetical protein